jgi:hypothetical protein
MLYILQKYINEIHGDKHQKKAQEWINKHGNK